MLPVTVDDLAARWRPIATSERDQAFLLLEDAWELLKSKSPGVEARVVSGVQDKAVVAVLCAMVRRVMSNPDGYVSETIGNYSYSRGSSSASVGGMYVTDVELEMLAASTTTRAFSVRQVAVPFWSC